MDKPVIPYLRQPTILTSLPGQPQSLIPQQAGVIQTGLNIRESFNNFIEPFGQMVILQKLNLHLHCANCWDEKLGEGDPQCPYCLGRGYQSVYERHISRRVSSLSEHRTQLMEQSSPGDEIVDEIFWFFEWNANPQEADYIYEVTWNDATKTLVDGLYAAYQITYAFPFRAAGGRIEFWRTSAKTKPIDRDLTGQHLRRLASQTMAVPVDGILRYGLNQRNESK